MPIPRASGRATPERVSAGAAAPASRRMSARLVSSSTPAIAFRTSSISRRTAQTISSGQSAQEMCAVRLAQAIGASGP
jgi:hypothetical protein